MTVEASLSYAELPAQRVAAANAIEYAYRDLGHSDVPLVLLQHFRGTGHDLPGLGARLSLPTPRPVRR
jgi:hypothetical protein